ncbi:MAG: T9SS type A sorting domain-containing protein [Bacteroidetes bacterium]|nr:T9SS type A sorting domain-containing protein [Bacteroidota bacterium]
MKFTIPSVGARDRASVQLKIYDVLGSEIATLVNEEKSVGSYEVEWNASGFTSGVYFYELKVNRFYSVKKMILLR